MANRNVATLGWVKGQPLKYIRGHKKRQAVLPKPPPPNPSGVCLCGCGAATPIAKWTSHRDGTVYGEHIRYVRGHNQRKAGPWLNSTDGRWYVYCVGYRKRDAWARVVLEDALGRPLRRGYVAHHLNGVPADDRAENLYELSVSRHRKLHSLAERGGMTLREATALVLGAEVAARIQ